MRAAVIVFPGSNCDRDVALALRQVSGREPLMIWHRETDLPPLDLIVVPGGFTPDGREYVITDPRTPRPDL